MTTAGRNLRRPASAIGAGAGGPAGFAGVSRRRAIVGALTLLGAAAWPPRHSTAEAAMAAAIVYDTGGRFDHSFNEAAYDGALRFSKDTGTPFRDFEITGEVDRREIFDRLARRGADPIIGVGFGHRAAIAAVAAAYPARRFVIIDTIVDLPNVRSIVFREHEGCFLVGMLAAMATKTGRIGFVGGMESQLLRKCAHGYAQGAQYVRPAIEVVVTMVGTTPAAWTDPARGAELARSQLDRGADVIFAAAGSSGLGVLQAAADAGKLSIGVDSDQNGLHPGSVLTSMLKRTDVAVYRAMAAARDGSWRGGTVSLGLAEGALDWALDDDNKRLITPEMKARVDRAKADIIAHRISVIDITAGH